ncbi:MAG: NAD-dependent epimerase/dehydratase family protein [Methanomassiliicoccales archaeon]|jgi:UDP-glucose 4-epimerase|nr:NAD-dependent epimerase/dehydratase family protein [Methanomassiliicoccales archaeon]
MKLQDRRIIVTGCAGFIGSHLTERLVNAKNEVIGIDNFSAGKREFLASIEGNRNFELLNGDLLSLNLDEIFCGSEIIFHFAANPEVRVGTSDTRIHLDQNVFVTYRVLEAARKQCIKSIVFPSTSTVYGEPEIIPTPENYGPLLPISLYGASKLACEALISAYCHTFDMSSVIFRFANVVGPRSTHNVLHDFLKKLERDPKNLEILGSPPGTRKSYIHVSECIDAMILGTEKAGSSVEIFNIGSEDSITVKQIADIVVEELGLADVAYLWTGGVKGGRGWVGDVKEMLLSIQKIERLGWRPKLSSADAVRKAVREMIGERRVER